MNLGQIRTAVKQHGHEEVDDIIVNQWINDAYQDVADRQAWPWLRATASGPGNVTINDLGHVFQVIDTTNKTTLDYADARDLYDGDPTLAATGNPAFWYVYELSEQIRTYPASSNTIAVDYIKVPTNLALDADVPLLPTRFHWLLTQGACMYASQRDGDQTRELEYEQRYEDGIQKMIVATFTPNYDGAPFIQPGRSDSNSIDW